MARRVGNINAAGQYCDGEPVGRERGPVRCSVDAERTTGHHGRIPLGQAGGQLRRDVLAVCGRRTSSDDGRGPVGYLV